MSDNRGDTVSRTITIKMGGYLNEARKIMARPELDEAIHSIQVERDELKQENEALRAALGFYAKHEVYHGHYHSYGGGDETYIPGPIMNDQGDVARQALLTETKQTK